VLTAEDRGGGNVHAPRSGAVDQLAEDDAHALTIIRSIVATLPTASRCMSRPSRHSGRSGRATTDDRGRGADHGPGRAVRAEVYRGDRRLVRRRQLRLCARAYDPRFLWM
jgi:hypothetical protein